MSVLKKAINNQKKYDDFPWTELFDKLGMHSTSLEQDHAGTFVGGSYGWSSARDIAKLGLLYLNNGKWDGEQLFPEDWVRWTTSTVPAQMNENLLQSEQMRLNQEDYGGFWWLNKKLPMNQARPFPDVSEDMLVGMGYKGQTMAIIPSENAVVIRLGNDGLDKEEKLDRAHLLKLFMESLKEKPSVLPPPKEAKDEAFAFNGTDNIWQIMKAVYATNTSLDDGIVMSPAKDLCSCIFLVKQGKSYCLKNHEQYQTFRNFGFINGLIREAKIDMKNKTVTTENRHHTAVATFINEKLGCKVTRFRANLRGQEMLEDSSTSSSDTK